MPRKTHAATARMEPRCHSSEQADARPGSIPEEWTEEMEMPNVDRFWSKVEKTEGCWVWVASRNALGYGHFFVTKTQPRKAHRVAWELTNGPIPDGLLVLHRCDNPPCVRPDHLFLGTQADNMRDCVAKGRRTHAVARMCGEANSGAKLTAEDVRQIRCLVALGMRQAECANMFRVSAPTVSAIANRTRWRSLGAA